MQGFPSFTKSLGPIRLHLGHLADALIQSNLQRFIHKQIHKLTAESPS